MREIPEPICDLEESSSERSGKQLTESEISYFRDIIYTHYEQNPRPFHWRETTDPYHILLSELMLQQTQTERALPKYLEFLEVWPTFHELAEAPFPEILARWKGLGYNRRAIALKEIAVRAVDDFNGTLPDSYEQLLSLPMVGPSTASAVLSFAFGKPSLYLETNIRRVLLYFFFCSSDGVKDRDLYSVLSQVQDSDDPKNWYYALMDYGVLLKKCIKNPNRRSAHYTRQAAFKNSNREVRGRILTIMTEVGRVSESRLLSHLDFPEEQVFHCLNALIKEGFLRKDSVFFDEAVSESECMYSVNTI